MKITYLAAVMMMFSLMGNAQQDYFIFIQQPSGQPFYVRMGEDSYSSTAGGHLILSPMKDTTYSMYIGFPRSKYPEQLFTVKVDKKDRGFELKQFDGNWQLFDLQSQQLVRAEPRPMQTAEGVKRTDSYSNLMAGVVDDTTVLYIDSMAYRDTAAAVAGAPLQPGAAIDSAAMSQAKPVDTVVARAGKKNKKNKAKDTAQVKAPDAAAVKPAEAVRDTVATAKANVDTANVKAKAPVADTTARRDTTVSAANEPRRDPRDIIRYRTENVAEGKLMIFLDRTGAVTDTIRIIVPR